MTTTDNGLINGIVAIGLFFIMLPFVMLVASQSNSRPKVFIIIAIYLGVLFAFYTGYIYTTPVGDFIKDLEQSIMMN